MNVFILVEDSPLAKYVEEYTLFHFSIKVYLL